MSKVKTSNPSLPSAANLSAAEMIHLYREMLVIRQFEKTIQVLLRDRKLPGFAHVYIGEEAAAVGVMAHLNQDDWITSTHRGHGHALAKGVPPKLLMAELGGKAVGCNGGRGGTMHVYMPSVGLFGTNGLVGGGIPSAVGLAISAKTRASGQVVAAFFGDGATSHGAFHESLNFAGIQNAPVVFVCENNLYATATPLRMATLNTNVASKAAAYGIPGIQVDGNDVLAVWQAAAEAVQRARAGGGPTLIEAQTYRQAGHQEGDPVIGWCRTQEEWDAWFARDPVVNFRRFLVETKGVPETEVKSVEDEVDREIQEAVDFTLAAADPDPATVLDHIWAEPINPDSLPYAEPTELPGETARLSWMDAVRDGIAEEMRRDKGIIYFGEGTGDRGGSFGHTKNLFKEFGGDRMIDTPICELGFTGAGIGASASGCRTISDLMLSDFLWEAAGQIVLQASKLRYMSNGQVSAPLVIRSGGGCVKQAGPHHSGMYHPVWAHCPGLIVVVPSNPADAKGLMKTALRAGDPVVFIEQKTLLSVKGPVPSAEYYVPFGKARVARQGTDLTIVSCGLWLCRSIEAAEKMAAEGISCEVIDLRTIVPLDVDTIVASVSKTGKLLVVDEGYSMCGVGGEIASAMMEQAFDELDAPVGRLHVPPVAHPFSPVLEDAIVADVGKIVTAAKDVIAGRPPIPYRAKGPVSAAPIPAAATPTPAQTVAPETAAAPATPTPPAGAAKAGIPVNMPNMDLIITEATIVGWHKKVGDAVTKGEALLEIETDKAVTNVESPADGVLIEILAKPGTVVPLGQQLGTIGA